MFQNAVIDIAIGLVLMYLVLSVVCTVINEFIATKLKLRAATLESGMKQLLDDPLVRNAFYGHGLIDGTSKSATRGAEALSSSLAPSMTGFTTTVALPVDAPAAMARAAAAGPAAAAVTPATAATATVPPTAAQEHPSYLAADTFAKALIGSLDPAKPIPVIGDIENAVKALPASNMKDALLAGLTSAGNDLNQFRTEVAKWFDDSMDRLSGAYKRQLKWISLIIGLLVAIIVNADSFDVGYALWSDNTLRAQMVQVAGTMRDPQAGKPPAETVSDLAKAFESANATLRPLPIGWPLRTWPGKADAVKPTDGGPVSWFWFAVTKLLGWIATGFALSLGAAILVRCAGQADQDPRLRGQAQARRRHDLSLRVAPKRGRRNGSARRG